METALSESTALSQKSEREYVTLRDSVKGLVESWKTDTDRLREEMTKREQKWRGEAESVGKKYRLLVEEIKGAGEGRDEVKKLREEDAKASADLEKAWKDDVERMKGEVEKSSQESADAAQTARYVWALILIKESLTFFVCRELAGELARLRRLMQNAGRSPSDSSFAPDVPPP